MITEQEAKELESESVKFIEVHKEHAYNSNEYMAYTYEWRGEEEFEIHWEYKHGKRLVMPEVVNYHDLFLYERSRVYWGFKEKIDQQFALKSVLGSKTYAVIDKHTAPNPNIFLDTCSPWYAKRKEEEIKAFVKKMRTSFAWKHFHMIGYGTSGKNALDLLEKLGVGKVKSDWYTEMYQEVYSLEVDKTYPLPEVERLARYIRSIGFAVSEDAMG